MARQNQDEYSRPTNRRGRGKWGKRLLWGIGLLCLACFLLPTLLLNRAVVVPLANRFAGIAPLKLDIDSLQGGWLSHIGARGVRLSDTDGNVLLRIDELKTEKTLLGWSTNSSNLETITVSGLESIIVCENGTTSLETALEHLLAPTPEGEQADSEQSANPLQGKIALVDAKLMLVENGRPEKWVVEIPTAQMTLPTTGQWLGPIELEAAIGDASGTYTGAAGKISAHVQQSEASQALVLDATVEQLPLEFWHVLHARLPDVPIDALQGRFSAKLSGQLTDTEHWSFDAQQLNATDLLIAAPTLLGQQPAKLLQISTQGKATLDGKRLIISETQLQCDFATAAASGNLPWPLQIPTAAQPIIPGATFDARGTVDLPKLVAAAQTLLPIRDDLQLQSGTTEFILSQQESPESGLGLRAAVRLKGLKAIASGQALDWKTPLAVDVAVNNGANGPVLAASATADFCELQAGGDLHDGNLAANLDLSKLHAEASRWIELPIANMTGGLIMSANWQMNAENLLVATGSLQTTPLTIARSTGNQITEPAWQGSLNGVGKIEGTTPSWINSARLSLKSASEELTVELKQPLRLSAIGPGEAPAKPADFSVTLQGDLANWKRRSLLALTEPLPVDISGKVSLAVQGRLDLAHAEIVGASWNAEPLHIATEQMNFSESRMIGSFSGLVDTSNLMKLEIQDLKIQSTSLSLEASDSAAPGGRTGQATYRVDLGRLMNNIGQPTTQAAADGQIAAAGMLSGNLNWTVAADTAKIAMQAAGNDVVIVSRTAANPAGEPLWNEPDVRLGLTGNYATATGNATLDNLQIQTPWMNYAGTLTYTAATEVAFAAGAALPAAGQVQPASAIGSATVSPGDASTTGPKTLQMQGQLVYDCGLLAQKLVPYTGGQVEMAGQHTTPVQIKWVSSSDPNASSLSGLNANASIGWQQARVAGIDVGQAAVPISVTAGKLASKTEIPVSGGVLRWDITSDLAAEEMVITQTPMTVLENVAITQQMCNGWLKFVAPLVAEATSIDGRLTLKLDQANFNPSTPTANTTVGQLLVHDAQVGPGPLSTQVLALVSQIDSIRRGQLGQSMGSQQTWLLLPEQKIDFEMVDGVVHHKNLKVRVGDANISTSGSVAVSGQMNMLAQMPIPDDWVDKSPLLASMRGQSLQFPVQGTVTQPQINTDFLRQFGQQAVQGAAQGLLQKGLSRGLEKLFGPSGGN